MLDVWIENIEHTKMRNTYLELADLYHAKLFQMIYMW
jgi:hypothetical protein